MIQLQQIFRRAGINDDNLEEVCSKFKRRIVEKNEVLLEIGQVCTSLYFIEKGSMILGTEVNDQKYIRHYAKENEFMSSLDSFARQVAGTEFLKAPEPCVVHAIGKRDFDILLRRYDVLADLYQQCIIDTLIKCQHRMSYLYGSDSTYYQEVALPFEYAVL
ncbi:MAG: cyclic nucleotide-binding domain-containing protein [Chitinophagaceae bacterium]|nr:MAG: cyclic nucleotide-binding domain-containing protein [Chitinophagaceae bacterium]